MGSVYSGADISDLSLREALLRGLPVDDIPDGAEVLSLAVLVLQAKRYCEH